MILPDSLKKAIETLTEHCSLGALTDAREKLSERYRGVRSDRPFITSDLERLAYVVARLPATYAAVYAALKAVKKSIPDLLIKSVLDLGSGPGTAMWAFCELFPEIQKFSLVERDPSLADLGRQLAKFSNFPAISFAEWQIADLEHSINFASHDLVILSYSAGELDQKQIFELLNRAWDSATQLLLIIEPGTPSGFARIRAYRDELLLKGAQMIAPCPHSEACPMLNDDWCHFSARIERSSIHRRLKGGDLGHEDEKFSYIAVGKNPIHLFETRVLRHPQRHSGFMTFNLCTKKGIEKFTVSKKMGDFYKQARKVEWGDNLIF